MYGARPCKRSIVLAALMLGRRRGSQLIGSNGVGPMWRRWHQDGAEKQKSRPSSTVSKAFRQMSVCVRLHECILLMQ